MPSSAACCPSSLDAFLNALKGKVPAAYNAMPELPEDGPKTPEP